MNVYKIPSRKIREVRPCYNDILMNNDCVFYVSSEFGGECKLHNYERNAKYSDELERPEKCPDHFYQDEMQALLNDRNVKDFLCYL